MSSKSDDDNRANQLNPNNDAYYSSRGGSRGGYDDDDEVDYVRSVAIFPGRAAGLGGAMPRSETFAFAAVSMDGNVVFRTAVFEAPGAWSNTGAARWQLEDYLTGFEPLAEWRLAMLLAPSEMALFAVFDPTESCLPWHIPFSPKDPRITRGWISVEHMGRLGLISKRLQPMPERGAMWEFVAGLDPEGAKRLERERQELQATKLDPAPFVQALRNAVVSDAQSWGTFSVPSQGRMLLSDAASVRTQLLGLDLASSPASKSRRLA